MLESIPFDMSLRDVLGDRLRVFLGECAGYGTAGVMPKSVALPANADEAALALKAAAAEGAVVVLRGAGTKAGRPPAPRSVDVVMDTTNLAGIIDLAAADLTVTVGAGTPLSQLDSVLSGAGLFWPCDAPFAQASTIGGTIAANANGALRQRYGAVRDLLLGARIITPDGIAARSGARVVKSVAGYDIHKLIAGSHGTLALIAEATLKVAPLPETERAVVARFRDAASACAAAGDIARSNLFVMATTVHDAVSAHRVGGLLAHSTRGGWLLTVRCGGNRRSVARQVEGVVSAARTFGAEGIGNLDRGGLKRAWAEIRELAGGSLYPADKFIALKFAALPSEIGLVLEAVAQAGLRAETSAHPSAGLAFAHVPAHAETDVPAMENVLELFRRCARSGWIVQYLGAPPRLANRLPAPPVAAGLPVRLLRSIKAAFDPAGVLDPGRLPGGV